MKSPARSVKGKGTKSKSKLPTNDSGDSPSFKVPLPKSSQTGRDSHAKSEPPSPAAKLARSTHRLASSVSLAKRASLSDLAASSSDSRPLSMSAVMKLKSMKRLVSPDDDTVSIAESCKSKSGRVRRSEAQRIQYLKDDPNCEDFEPFRAVCKKCRKRLCLSRKTTYALGSWIKHRERCDRNTKDTAGSEEEASSADEKEDVLTLPPVSSSGNSESVDYRMRAILETDPRAEVIESERMRCRNCRKWVKLGAKLRYGGVSQWLIHQMRCHHSLQGGDVADAARVAMTQALRLTKDDRVSTFTFDTVECAVCGKHVSLKPDCDFDLTTWEQHKSCCPKTSTKADGDAFSVRPPPSSTSSLSFPSDGDDAVQIGKRRRDGDEDEDRPPRNRPRTEANEATDDGGLGALGWLLHPFRMFVLGFREGMQASSSS